MALLDSISEAVQGIANATQSMVGSLAQPNVTVMGVNVPLVPIISTYDYFLTQMESWVTTVPIECYWIAVLDRFPPAVVNGAIQQYERMDGDKKDWNFSAAVSALNSFPLQKVNGCLFAQKCSIPQEQVMVGDAVLDNGGGYINGIVFRDRYSYAQNQLSLGFLETNSSFADLMIRPWVILGSHMGRVARPGDTGVTLEKNNFLNVFETGYGSDISNFNLKTNITLFQYSRSYQGLSMIPRKVWQFYDCMPVQVTEQELSMNGDTSPRIINTRWAYSHYSIKDNLYIPIPDYIDKLKNKSVPSILAI